MELIRFSTDQLDPCDRFLQFCRSTPDFVVEMPGDLHAFYAHWRLLRLGNVNALHSRTAPMRYRRDAAMIAADGRDRVTMHIRLGGLAVGTLDGQPTSVGPGEACVWDLSRPLDLRSEDENELLILTLPRYMMEEVLPRQSYSGRIADSPELHRTAVLLRHLLDRADLLPDEGAASWGRAMRDMAAAAMMAGMPAEDMSDVANSPLIVRACAAIDAALAMPPDETRLAASLGVPGAELDRALEGLGGLDVLVERRRLLGAYRMLADPSESTPVAHIALRCGFPDPARFSRRFRAVFGTPPSDLRRRSRAALPFWAGAYEVERLYDALLT